MRLTVADIMKRVATTVNQEAVAPTAGNSEYLLWLEYINRGVEEWAEANDWESLRRDWWPQVSGISGATVGLPLDFRKLAASPRLYGENEIPYHFPHDIEEQQGLRTVDERYITLTGDISNGHALVFHPGTLASGASLLISYFAMPTSLASPAQVPLVNDPQFLIDRTIAYVFESRSDARFQIQENRSRERLLGMIENANAAKYNSYAGSNNVIGPERKQGFRFGRD